MSYSYYNLARRAALENEQHPHNTNKDDGLNINRIWKTVLHNNRSSRKPPRPFTTGWPDLGQLSYNQVITEDADSDVQTCRIRDFGPRQNSPEENKRRINAGRETLKKSITTKYYWHLTRSEQYLQWPPLENWIFRRFPFSLLFST